ncbi:MAG: hypothetical protein LBP41_02370 [Holosporaceae bacterium]|jgi:hypothetical protein|nr:hypothetical protein [Holosporaceae bacterium]
MKKTLIALFMFGSAAAMNLPNIPKLNNLEKNSHCWIANYKLFDIRPIFLEHISEFSPEGKEFVNNITELKLEECKNSAEQYFLRRDTEEAEKCMELLALAAGWPGSRFGRQKNLTKQIVALYQADKVTQDSIIYKEFCGDVMYKGMYRTFRKEDGTLVSGDEFNTHKAEFFRWYAQEMYSSTQSKSFSDRNLHDFVSYSTSPEYYPYNVWKNWRKLRR